MSTLGGMGSPLESYVQALRTGVLRPLARRYPEREELVELIALALCAGENLLIVGPPGTAKSEIVSEFAARVGGRYFEYLLTRFTEPSEIFGPVDIVLLREGRFATRTEGMLPDAEIAFLDEIFNAGSAILNTLLGIINDGIYRRGSESRPTGLVSVLAAANRVADDPQLRALDDRFALRVAVEPVGEERLDDLLRAGWAIERRRLAGSPPARAPSFSMAEMRQLGRAVADVSLGEVRQPLAELIRRIRRTGMFLSDRRAVRLQRLVGASAVLSGRSLARASDLWPARYAWEVEEDRETLEELVDELLCDQAEEDAAGHHPLAFRGRRPLELLEAVERLEAEVGGLDDRLPAETADSFHNKLHDLDREMRWCRPHGPEEENALRELGTRIESLGQALGRKEPPP